MHHEKIYIWQFQQFFFPFFYRPGLIMSKFHQYLLQLLRHIFSIVKLIYIYITIVILIYIYIHISNIKYVIYFRVYIGFWSFSFRPAESWQVFFNVLSGFLARILPPKHIGIRSILYIYTLYMHKYLYISYVQHIENVSSLWKIQQHKLHVSAGHWNPSKLPNLNGYFDEKKYL